MKAILTHLTVKISAGLQQKNLKTNDGLLDPKKLLHPQEKALDFFSKWISY